MMVRTLGAVGLFLLTMGAEASAMRQHRPTARISCTQVRYYVARYSAQLAEMYARSRGATDAQIERARRCLVSHEPTETAQQSRLYIE